MGMARGWKNTVGLGWEWGQFVIPHHSLVYTRVSLLAAGHKAPACATLMTSLQQGRLCVRRPTIPALRLRLRR